MVSWSVNYEVVVNRFFHCDRTQHAAGRSPMGSGSLDVEDVVLGAGVNLDMLHHTCTPLSLRGPDGTTKVMVYGGRYSPCSAVNVWPLIVSALSHDTGTSVTVAGRHVAVTATEDVPASRWRHSAVCLKSLTPSSEGDFIVVFGGRTTAFEVHFSLILY
jgi:hypothetical protein